MIIIVMGVSGSGKSTIGQALANRLGGEFIEGDFYHPESNIEKMRRGVPLADRDRSVWLTKLSEEISRRKRTGKSTLTVFSCSALKKSYRNRLRKADCNLRLLYLSGPHDLLEQRLTARRNHFMSLQLLTSQLATLEPPHEDESPIVADISSSVDDIVDHVYNKLSEP